MAEKEFSREEAQSFLYHGPSQQGPSVTVERATAPIPVPPPAKTSSVLKGKAVARDIELMPLVETVGKANKEIQALTPVPKAPSAVEGLVEQLVQNWKPLVIGAAATAAASYATRRLLGNKDLATTPVKIEPTFATKEETAVFKPVQQPVAPSPLAASFEQEFGIPLAQAEQLTGGKITNPTDAKIVGNALTKGQGVSVNPILGAVSNQPAGTPGVNPMDKLTQQPAAYPLIQPKSAEPTIQPKFTPLVPFTPEQLAASFRGENPNIPTAVDTLAAGGTPTQIATQTAAQEIDAIAPVAPPAELRTGTGKIAYAGQGPEPTMGKKGPQFKKEYPSLEAVPKGYAFVPGAQYIDPLRNDLGQAEYKKAFTGRDFPQTYEEAIATGKDINRSLGRATREEAKAAGLPPAETTEGIAKKTTENKKLVKIIGKAGLAGALVSLADLALAKTPEEKANAGMGLLGAILPPGMDINAAGAGSTLSPEVVSRNQIAYENQFKLGSPYAQTEEAKAYRLREKAGAGRGIMPPSAYQR